MIHFGWAIAGLFVGAFLGFLIAGLCAAAAQGDREDEMEERKWM